jgi:hypothetical protein
MEVGLSILLEQVVNSVVNNLELEFFCLFLLLNFKPYFIMSSKVITEDMLKSSGSVENPIILVVISNYPFSNGGYLVSFSQVGPDGSPKSYDPAYSLDFEASKLSTYLDFSSIFLPAGCYYLSDNELAGFIKALSFGASTFEMKLVPASSQMQGLIVVNVDEKSLSKYEQEEED